MRVYVSQTRSADLIRRLWRMGIGECCVRGELPPRRHPWFYDNGAYADWANKRPFDAVTFLADMDSIYHSIDRPEFIVLPDIVAGGVASLRESMRWVHRVKGLAPLYLAVQDGMEPSDIVDLRNIAGLFVGGSLEWKLRHGEKWVEWAHHPERKLKCHIGRMGTARRVRWGSRIECDSIDSALPLWSEDNLQRFLGALEESAQLDIEAA